MADTDLAVRVRNAQHYADAIPPVMGRFAHSYLRTILNGPDVPKPRDTDWPSVAGYVAAIMRGEVTFKA